MAVTVTEQAAARSAKFSARSPGAKSRVSVEAAVVPVPDKFDIEHQQAGDDIAITRDGATVLIDPIPLGYLAGSKIDFVDDLIGASFKVDRPERHRGCGADPALAVAMIRQVGTVRKEAPPISAERATVPSSH